MKRKLCHINRPWRRLVVTIVVYCLLFLRLFASSRARNHWVGYGRRRCRPERALIVSLFLLAMIMLEPREYAIWGAVWGGITSIIVTLYAIYMVMPRKQYHRIKS